MIGIFDLPSLYAIFYRIPTVFYLIIIFTASYKRYHTGKRRDRQTMTLITLYEIAVIGGILGLISSLIHAFWSPIPLDLYIIDYSIYLIMSSIATVYSLVFTVVAFSSHPSERTMKFIYVGTGAVIGIIIASMFSYTYWQENISPPIIVITITALMIFVSSVCVTIYAFRSMKRQTIVLNKASMRYYYIGSLIFTIGIAFVIILSTQTNPTIALILNNLPNILQIINTAFVYIAFFRPDWFSRRYGRIKRAESWFKSASLTSKIFSSTTNENRR